MNSASPATAPTVMLIPHINEIAGPLILGLAFNVFFLGVLSVQVYLYCFVFTHDPQKIKAIVYLVYAFEALQAILFLVDANKNFGIGPEIPSDLNLMRMLWFSVPILTGLVTFLCQGWYAFRIWRLAKDIRNIAMKAVSYIIVVICAAQLATSFIIGLSAKNAGSFEIYYTTHNYKLTSGIWYTSCALGDVLIAICMILLLVQFQDTENKFPTRNILEKCVRLIFGTNLVTAALGISILVMMLMPINPSYYQAILAILGKSYSNAMMVQLNSRMYTSLDVDTLDPWKQSTRVRHPQCHRASQLRIQCPEIESENTL